MKSKKLAMGVAMFAVLALVAAACGDSGGSGSNDALKNLTGDVLADGSSTVQPITSAIAEEFRGAGADGVKISVGTSGTSGGGEKFCNGELDIWDASRPIKDSEKTACTAKTIEYIELKVAVDGLSLIVNPQNSFAECLTVAELKKIWEPGSKVNTWSAVRSGFPNQPLKLYGAGTDSGTFDYFTEEIVGEQGKSRSDYVGSEDDNVLVQGVAGDVNALGYFGYAYYVQNKNKLKLVGVDGGGSCVTPSDSTINDGSYKPLSRPLFIYVAKKSITKPQVKAFVDFYLDTVNEVLPSVGYVALHESDLTASKQTWSAAAA